MLRTSDIPVIIVHADDTLHVGPILVAVDDSRASLAALHCAIERAGETSKTLVLLHVFEEHRVEWYAEALGLRSLDARARAMTAAEDALNDAADHVHAVGIACSTEMQVGSPGATIVAAAKRHTNSSIAIGTHGRGELGRLFFGNVAAEVIRTARVPVYVVHHQSTTASADSTSERSDAGSAKIPAFSVRHQIRQEREYNLRTNPRTLQRQSSCAPSITFGRAATKKVTLRA